MQANAPLSNSTDTVAPVGDSGDPCESKQTVVALPVLSPQDRLVLGGLAAAWLLANVVFWFWWIQPDHLVSWPGMLLASLALAYDLAAMPAFFLFFVFRMRRPAPMTPRPNLRVAMVTAIVPSVEALEVLERTLAGMVANRYPHDSWVLDEGGDPRVADLCRRYGAFYWSRHGIPELNQQGWPLQTRTKSGNYNGWLTTIGYDRYDFMVQLDTDHVPAVDYLDRVLGYFNDPKVAYVALPSVYSNLDDWPARGSSEQSQVFQGPMQMGYYGWARSPMIIGSHAAYRLTHLREIGGFGPSRAEDHLDTLNLVRAGYQGVFVPENLACGLGPHTVADYLVQEHQWAFSIAQVFMKYSRGSGKLTWRQRLLFVLSELWYTRFALAYLTLYLLPLIALITNQPIVSVPFLEFMLYTLPITTTSILVLMWCYHRDWFRPGTHFFVSWQGIVLTMARWPIVLIALVNAVISIVLRGGAFRYMVTPKGDRGMSSQASVRIAFPFIVLATIPLVVVGLYPWLSGGLDDSAAGYIVFALLSAVYYGGFLFAIAFDHVRVNRKVGVSYRRAWLGAAPVLLLGLVVLTAIGASSVTNRERVSAALTYWPGVLQTATPAASGVVAEETVTVTVLPAADPTCSPVPLGTVTRQPVIPTVPAATPTPEQAATATAVASVPTVESWLFDPSRSGVTFGAYDPDGALDDTSGLTHLFVAWSNDGTGGVPADAIRATHARGVPVMLSLEPWPIEGIAHGDVVPDILAGLYDDVIRDAARSVAGLETPILIRFAHEVDQNGLYPWAGGDPDEYIAAWIRVVDLFEQEGATNALWVWSPGGTLESPAYYPGPEWVDYIGLTILQYSGWERDAGYDPPRPFVQLIEEKYQLFSQFGKPLILAETGISLDPALKTVAVQQMIETLPSFPLIRAVVYFNNQNPETPVSEERPDWSLGAFDIAMLREVLAEQTWVEPPAGQDGS